MSSIEQAVTSKSASVFSLFSPALLPATLMLGGGVVLYAVESYITATIAPSIVRHIGGLALFSPQRPCQSLNSAPQCRIRQRACRIFHCGDAPITGLGEGHFRT